MPRRRRPTCRGPTAAAGAELADVQPGPVPGCRKAPRWRASTRVIRGCRRARDRLGCDHRAVFANTYLLLTKEIKRTVKRNPRFFSDNRWLIYEVVEFANFYFAHLPATGAQLPEAWQIAFDTAASGDQNAAQDMLLGINAHVQRDMPYVRRRVGIRKPDGSSRKPDHDVGNKILAAGYETIVRDIERRYDPFIALTNSSATPARRLRRPRDGQGLARGRLAQRRAAAERQDRGRARSWSPQTIEQNAAALGAHDRLAAGPPGYRGQRDAYCAGAADKALS